MNPEFSRQIFQVNIISSIPTTSQFINPRTPRPIRRTFHMQTTNDRNIGNRKYEDPVDYYSDITTEENGEMINEMIDQADEDSVGTYQTTMKIKSPGLTGTIDAKKPSTKHFDSANVLYTIAVSLSSMVVITVIAVLVICIIKRRRQGMLKELSYVKNDTQELGNFNFYFIS